MDRDERGREIKRSKKMNSDETGSGEFHSEIGGFPLPVAQINRRRFSAHQPQLQ